MVSILFYAFHTVLYACSSSSAITVFLKEILLGLFYLNFLFVEQCCGSPAAANSYAVCVA